MLYSHWESKNTIKDFLQKIDYRKEAKSSGLPVIYEGDNLYALRSDGHSLIIGSTGSGKTQSLIFPLMKLSMLAGESVVVNDPKGDLYRKTAKEFKNRRYNTIVIDFDNAIYGNYFNPLNLAYRLFKEGNKDRSINVIEEIGYYIFTDIKPVADPFWGNAATDYFTGLCLYLFSKEDNEVNLTDVFTLGNKLANDKECSEFIREIGDDNSIYYNVSCTINAPKETKGGIISVFNQKLKRFISKENLTTMMSKTDFDFAKIAEEKTIIYIISGYHDYSNSLIPLFINEVFEAINNYSTNRKKINIILDEFDSLLPIKNFAGIINYSRGLGINFTCAIQSAVTLGNTYGKENLEMLKLCFSNIVYLYANDQYTLEKVSKLCGNESEKKALISPEELKMIEQFEAIFLIPRVMPYRTKLVPDFKINWGIDFEDSEFELRK